MFFGVTQNGDIQRFEFEIHFDPCLVEPEKCLAECRVPAADFHSAILLAAGRSVKEHPGGKIFGKRHEAVRCKCRNEQKIAGTEMHCFPAAFKLPGTGKYHVNFVAVVRCLMIGPLRFVHFHGETSMAEQFSKRFVGSAECCQCLGAGNFHGYRCLYM